MLRSLSIENFRALREFRMSGLGRVNLLVGTNNCGKTSILEAIHILASPGQPGALVDGLARRGEVAETGDTDVNIRHLFHGHRVHEGTTFQVEGSGVDSMHRVVASISRRDPTRPSFRESRNGSHAQKRFFGPGDLVSDLGFSIDWNRGQRGVTIDVPLTRGDHVPLRGVSFAREEDELAPVQFIRTGGMSRDEVSTLFDATVLTPDENVLLEALHAVDTGIERIASVARHGDDRGEASIIMMVAGQRIPAGSMGDGVARLLGLALALVRARGGILLVDEIDTGLHYTVLTKMWELVYETAQRLDVQVFTTTHSRDCYESLAEIAVAGRHDISLQRIERGRREAIAFSEGELVKAAERGLEVR